MAEGWGEARLAITVGALDDSERTLVKRLAREVCSADAVEAISEAPLLALSGGDAQVTHVLAWHGDALVGYAQVDGEAASAELAVAPGFRRRGLASGIINKLTSHSAALRWWAHGDLPAARATADALGMGQVRQLDRMAVTLGDNGAPARQVPVPLEGIRLRTFQPGHDEDAWVALNANSFAGHPEQGKLTRTDLEQRMAQPWFDPAGFILAEPSGQVGDAAQGPQGPRGKQPLGYIWTKVQDGIGEVYGIGVHGRAQGQRLGTHLLIHGLDHLASRGIRQVILYVEADNAPAVASYVRQGFTVVRRHVQYARIS
jgi:mycothiol synthase